MAVSIGAAGRHRVSVHASCRRGSCRAKTRDASTSAPRPLRASPSTTWCATSRRWPRSSPRIRTSASYTSNIGQGPGGSGGAINTGRIGVDLKPRDRTRALSVDQVIASLRPKLAQVPGVRVFMVNQPPINLGGTQGARSLYQFTLQDTDTERAVRMGAEARSADARPARHRGRQQRSAAEEPAGADPDRSRQARHARAHGEPGGNGAVQRVRHAAGHADLRAEQSVPGRAAGGAGISDAIRARSDFCTCDRSTDR